MTASSAPPDIPGKWICEMCTYENFALSKRCTMCRSSKPLLGEDIFRLQDDGASALPLQQELCGAEAVTEKLKPLRISSPQGQASSASCIVKWACPTCTYENWPRALKCAMCGHMNPAPASPENTTRQKTPIGINDISQNASMQDLHEVDSMARRSKLRNTDWLWLQACLGVVEGDMGPVEAYLSAGGSAARTLSAHEVSLLDRASAFDPGHTLVHLAIRFQRQDILSALLSRISGGGPGLKRSPSYIAPDLASAIRRHIASSIRRKKGSFQCQYINEICTFCLPAEIEELPAVIQEQLFTELLDQDAQRCLETDRRINWNPEITLTLGSRLYALWNRSLGDCLCDAVCQGAYGVFDRDNALRIALAETMHPPHYSLYSRWSGTERVSARALHYVPDEAQLRTEWGRLLRAAATPRTPLNQIHIFALAHVMRRPIIVYGINVVNSFRGEALGYAKFEGVYLPLAWERESCSASPLCIGYTRGHFSALVPLEPHDSTREEEQESDIAYLPLTDVDGKLLPVHFLDCDEMVDEEAVLRRWLSVYTTPEGCLVAKQRIHSRPLLVAQMLEEWLNHYRRVAQQTHGPFPPRIQTIDYSSDPETDEE